MRKQQVYFSRSCILLAAAALAACGSTAVKKDEGSVVEARALERWNFLIAHQAEKAYDYLTPGYRLTITRDTYAAQKNDVAMRWKSAHVRGHSCETDSCTVTVMVDTQVPMPGIGKAQPATLPTEEHWIKVDRSWYYLPDTRIRAAPVAPDGQAQPGSTQDAVKHPN